MELDKRIKDISTIQTILRYDVNCIGCKGYFFDEFIQTKDLSKCRYGELIDITTHDDRNDLCFKAEYEEGLIGFYRFFIPEADLKPIEKKYRPYTITEFVNTYSLGDEVIMRSKNNPTVTHVLFVEYEEGKDDVRLGQCWYTFMILFNNYEIYTDERWKPFGVEE